MQITTLAESSRLFDEDSSLAARQALFFGAPDVPVLGGMGERLHGKYIMA